MELPLLQWVLQGIPECIALAALAIAFAGHTLETKRILLVGLSQAVAVYLVRLLPLSFGVHFIFLIVLLAILLNVLLHTRLNRSLLAALGAMIILAAAETALASLMLMATGYSFEQVSENMFLYILFGWPHVIFLSFLALAIHRRRKGRPAGKEAAHV